MKCAHFASLIQSSLVHPIKQAIVLIFVVSTGEAWGYLGSRRFLFELDLQSDAVSGINYSLIEKEPA
ncbi:hypothetical protein GBA52_016555 [Prunus armeniaca]|nr:hypothetical protein GBA52_016555 [Prunus armeniaca]